MIKCTFIALHWKHQLTIMSGVSQVFIIAWQSRLELWQNGCLLMGLEKTTEFKTIRQNEIYENHHILYNYYLRNIGIFIMTESEGMSILLYYYYIRYKCSLNIHLNDHYLTVLNHVSLCKYIWNLFSYFLDLWYSFQTNMTKNVENNAKPRPKAIYKFTFLHG